MMTRSLVWSFCLALLGCATESKPWMLQPSVVDAYKNFAAYRSFADKASGTWVRSNAANNGHAAPQISVELAGAAGRGLGIVTITDSEGASQQLVAYSANVLDWTPPIMSVFCASEVDENWSPSGTRQLLTLQEAEPGQWLLARFDPESFDSTTYRRPGRLLSLSDQQP